MNDELRSKTTESVSIIIQDGNVRAAIFGLIQNDDDIMNKILETVTQAIVKNSWTAETFSKRGVDGIPPKLQKETVEQISMLSPLYWDGTIDWTEQWLTDR